MFFSVSMLMGLAMWAFMPVSGASCTSRTKALAVMAMVGMVMAAVSIKKESKKCTDPKMCLSAGTEKELLFRSADSQEKGAKEKNRQVRLLMGDKQNAGPARQIPAQGCPPGSIQMIQRLIQQQEGGPPQETPDKQQLFPLVGGQIPTAGSHRSVQGLFKSHLGQQVSGIFPLFFR